ncbi:hypothetical protein P8605_11230, partial [Streptomyces sp. T-3]|nr:hypothetical protein [Streptomyces sp. T-3]
MALQRYGARLRADRPWVIEVAVPGRSWPARCSILTSENRLPESAGPPLPAPALADVDRALGDAGYVRTLPIGPQALVDGAEFEVLDCQSGGEDQDGRVAEQAATELALARGARAVTVSVPAAEAGRMRVALEEVYQYLEGSAYVDDMRFLTRRLNAAVVDVMLPARVYDACLDALYRAAESGADELGRDRARHVIEYVEQARLSSGPWPAPREALQ